MTALACLQILLCQAGTGRESRYGPDVQVQEAVCRDDRLHGAQAHEVRGWGPGVQSGAQGGVPPLRGAALRGVLVIQVCSNSDRGVT